MLLGGWLGRARVTYHYRVDSHVIYRVHCNPEKRPAVAVSYSGRLQINIEEEEYINIKSKQTSDIIHSNGKYQQLKVKVVKQMECHKDHVH